MKKLLALLLSAAMTVSLAAFPASAQELDYVDEFTDNLNVAANDFLNTENENYISQRTGISQFIEQEAMGGTIVNAYHRPGGNLDKESYITYRVNPGYVLTVDAYNASGSQLSVLTANSLESDWTDTGVSGRKCENLTDRNGNPYAHEYYQITVPDGMFYAKIAIPRCDNGEFGSWQLGIRSVSMKEKAGFTDDLSGGSGAVTAEAFLTSEHPERYSIDTGNGGFEAYPLYIGRAYGGHGGSVGVYYRVIPGMILKVRGYNGHVKDIQFTFGGSADAASWQDISAQKYWTEGSIYDYYITVPENVNFIAVNLPSTYTDGTSIEAGDRWQWGVMSVSLSDEGYTPAPAEFRDELDTDINNNGYSNFTDSTKEGYVANRRGVGGAIEYSPRGGTTGNVYQRPGGYWEAEAYITYEVTPGKLAVIEYFGENFLPGDVIKVRVSSNGKEWTEIGGNKVEGSDRWYKYITLPENAYYMKVSLPYYGDYSTEDWEEFKKGQWNVAIMAVEVRGIEFEDTLDTPVASFLDKTAAGYVSQRVAIDASLITKEEGLWGYGHCYGWKDNRPTITYSVYPGYTFGVTAYNFKTNVNGDNQAYEKAPAIEFYVDGKWTAEEPYVKNLEDVASGNNTYAFNKYLAEVPAGAYQARVVIPAMDTDGDNWKFGIDTVALNTEDFPHARYTCTKIVSVEEGAFIVSGDITKKSGDAETVTVYFAGYDAQGKLLGVDMSEAQEMTAGGSLLSYYLMLDEGAASYKMFVWNSDGNPVLNAIPVTTTAE